MKDITISNKSIFQNKVILIIMMIILIKSPYLDTFPIIHLIYTYGGVLIFCFLMFFSAVSAKRSFPLFWIFLFWGTILISTIINGGNVMDFLFSNCQMISMCLVFNLWIEKSPDTLLSCVWILEILIYINLATLILYPDGLYHDELYTSNWFLGYKNIQVRTIIPIISLSLIRSFRNFGKVSLLSLITIISSILTFILLDSMTSLVGVFVFLLLLFIFHKKNKRLPRLVNINMGFFASVILSIGIIFFNMQDRFSYLIESLMKRDLTFTTRTIIWGKSIVYFFEKPLLGYGYLNGTNFSQMYLNEHYTHPHNYFLYILMFGGLFLFAILIIGVFYANKMLGPEEKIYAKIILFANCSLFFMGITESLTANAMIYPMLILAMKYDYIAKLEYLNKHRFRINFLKINSR